MISEGLALVDRLDAALHSARARRAAEHTASLTALDAIGKATALTRRYLEGAAKMHSGSLEMARFTSVSQAWLAAAQKVAALDLAGAEKALAKSEGWLAARPWKKLEKEDGGWRLQTVLDHCRTLLDGFEKGAAAK
jgi:hypothetical protein